MPQNIVLCITILQRGQHRDPPNLWIIQKFQTIGFKILAGLPRARCIFGEDEGQSNSAIDNKALTNI